MSEKPTKRLAHRDDLTGEHNFGDAGQLLFFLLFMAAWVTDSFFFKYSTFLNDHIPVAVQLTLGIIIAVLAAYLAWAGMRIVFGTVRQTPAVIRQGVFGVVRHPIYVAEMLYYLAMLCFSTSLTAAGIWILAIVFLHYISRYEERLLLERFGEDYRRYMAEVPMYFPRLARRKSR